MGNVSEIIYSNVPVGDQKYTFRPGTAGANSSSGIYIVVVRGDDFTVTRKIVVK